MPNYRLTKPAYIAVNGSPESQHFKAGAVVDFEGVPSQYMFPLDAAAVAAIEARRVVQPFEVAPNGVQAIDTRTGRPRVFAAN